MAEGAAVNTLFVLLPFLIILLGILPSVIAFVRGSGFKKQILLVNIGIYVISVICNLILRLIFIRFLPPSVIMVLTIILSVVVIICWLMLLIFSIRNS